MLILSIFLIFTIIIKRSESINLTYIVKKEQDRLSPSCVAEESAIYSGIGWVYPIPKSKTELPKITTKFIPTILNDFDCNFSIGAKCSKRWALKNWETPEKSFKFISGGRWEDFPTILTSSKIKEFEERIEIPNEFEIGFSIRASNYVELLICEGWNPYTYPCYHLNMSQSEIFLRKYSSVPKNISHGNILDSYKAYSNILSGEEWRNFVVSLDLAGNFELVDVNLNRTVIQFEDKESLKPLYLLMRSKNPSLWKIHHNHFMYTKTAQISRLGPILDLPCKDLCVSLYIATCPNCIMTFILVRGNERKILKEIKSAKENDWLPIRLKDENIISEKLNIFIETKFVDDFLNQTEGFWAIDDVRVCHENEIKITFLKFNESIEENSEIIDNISCQIVEHPKWRPKKLIYPEVKDFPLIEASSTPTTINLKWTDENINHLNYFITYKANDLCGSEPYNMHRVKSNGFLVTKDNEIIINNLIPYTLYNITFSTLLHEKEKHLSVNTLQTDLPTPEELPNKIQIQVSDSTAYVSWDKVDCTITYGQLIYFMNLTNKITNKTFTINEQTDNTVEIKNLQPFTTYSLNIFTTRKNRTQSMGMNNIDFTTKSAVAPALENLEIYSIDKNSVSLRYDLPKKSKGIPTMIQIVRCNALLSKKCKSSISLIKPCKMWARKYCIDINNLIPYQAHLFKISIKNDNTQKFGQETEISAFTNEQAPGAPTNLTYQIVDCESYLDYCHLNMSWLHPYNQNGTITFFNIILNSTDKNSNESKNIQEVMKIENQTYSARYNYQIKYIPYSTYYDLYVQSANAQYKSDFVVTHVKTADIGDHIDQSPELIEKLDNSVTFKAPPLDRRLQFYTLTIIVQDYNKNASIENDTMQNKKVYNNLCHNFGNTWVSQIIKITSNNTENVTIGSGIGYDKRLLPETQYCLTFIVTNKYKNTEHDVVYYEKLETPSKVDPKVDENAVPSSQYQHLYILLLLLLLVPAGFLVYKYVNKRKPKKNRDEIAENVYESLPFEECDNCVNNDTYDHLLHK